MLKRKKFLGGAIALTLALLMGVFAMPGVRSQVGQNNNQPITIMRKAKPNGQHPSKIIPTDKELDDAATPIVDLTSIGIADEKRQRKNKRHNHSGLEVLESPGPNVEVSVSPESSIPDFPFQISDLVVEGTVTDSKAFLSEDKTGVYSEYTITVSDVIKSSVSNPVNKDDSITVERFGGRVRYPSGQIVRCKVSGHGSPAVNAKYIFFLKKVDEDSYLILTAYELRGNKVFALDGSRFNLYKKGEWVFDKRNNQDLADFKKDLDKALKGESNETYKVY